MLTMAGCATKIRSIGTSYELWLVTRYDDLVWLTRHHELFSSAVFKNDPRPAYPASMSPISACTNMCKNYQADQFIQHDRPEHLEMRRVMHSYFTPKRWRPGAPSCGTR